MKSEGRLVSFHPLTFQGVKVRRASGSEILRIQISMIIEDLGMAVEEVRDFINRMLASEAA